MEKEPALLLLPHVVIFPLPVQGHINSMLKLAETLSLATLKVTFITTLHNYDRLTRFTDFHTRFQKYPDFELKTVPEFLPLDHSLGDRLVDLMESMDLVIKPVFRRTILESSPPVNCIIMDGILAFVSEIANDLRIPFIHFRTTSACSFWAYFSVLDIVQVAQLPIKGEEDMDRIITKVPGMETFLRCRDLPSFCRVNDAQDPNLQIITKETRKSSQAEALILNTFEDLEGPILSEIRKQCPKIYAIGPLHELLKTKTQASYQSSNSLRQVDRTCITWLNTQPSQSVLYISFGSITMITKDQLMEFWHGIVSSKKRFLWVIRPDSLTDMEEIPEQFQEGPKENGYVVKWAPQEEVLAHKAIGGFLTHSGWNSTLESIVAGVPMICWPFFADQQVNSRFVSEVWKLGLDMKDVCDRRIVEKMVNDLLVDRREVFVKSAARMAELARKSVAEGGSSSSNLNHLIQDIRKMCMKSQDN
ncbi:7-deoxyloganetic acid glucosyltransferase-like isoform X1 [Euphorbia lathyris]|uniref:7-deoxyloganetic acid glucosyltransferase-like isoform X1 n=1 Tax=Euphorbia lathyris TaxID=212925 RepID=UPI00331402E9